MADAADAQWVAVGLSKKAQYQAMKKHKPKLDKGTEVRRLARKAAPKPSSTRVVEDKRKKSEKYKKDFTEYDL